MFTPGDPWKHASTYHASYHDRFLPFRSPYPPVVYFSKMDMEQTVKDLQAQNAQFQQMFLAMAKG